MTNRQRKGRRREGQQQRARVSEAMAGNILEFPRRKRGRTTLNTHLHSARNSPTATAEADASSARRRHDSHSELHMLACLEQMMKWYDAQPWWKQLGYLFVVHSDRNANKISSALGSGATGDGRLFCKSRVKFSKYTRPTSTAKAVSEFEFFVWCDPDPELPMPPAASATNQF